jgi:hypothetical protein
MTIEQFLALLTAVSALVGAVSLLVREVRQLRLVMMSGTRDVTSLLTETNGIIKQIRTHVTSSFEQKNLP